MGSHIFGIVAYATVAATMCMKAPDYLKDMPVRAKLQFEGFDNATQPQKPHRESVRPVFALCHVPTTSVESVGADNRTVVRPPEHAHEGESELWRSSRVRTVLWYDDG